MDVSPYEGTVDVSVGEGGIVTMLKMIPGDAREQADKLRVKIRTSAKARTTDQKIAAEDMSVETEMDEPAYNLALLNAFIVSWNLTRRGIPLSLSTPADKWESIKSLPDTLYTPLVAKAKELLEAAVRPKEEQVGFRDSRGDGGPQWLHN
jgi:hypothetical protein